VSEDRKTKAVDSVQRQRWSFMTVLYLGVHSLIISQLVSCVDLKIQKILGALQWNSILCVSQEVCMVNKLALR